ncbi:MAG: serine--tRNA ligase, partial [Nitrospina sp.]|nr:serine--tRNA ligase [Nitrospina sp.]
MLDLKIIRENPEAVKTRLKRRGGDFKELDELLIPEEARREGLQQSENLKSKKKKLSAQVGQLKQKGQDASEIMEEVRVLNIAIKELDDKIQIWEQQVQEKLLGIPNIPDDSIVDGADESCNRRVRDWGTKPEFSFQPKSHVEIGEELDLIDLKRAAKISGARFAVYKGQGAALLRALINFMIDVQTRENGYQELYPPF